MLFILSVRFTVYYSSNQIVDQLRNCQLLQKYSKSKFSQITTNLFSIKVAFFLLLLGR